MKSKMGLGLSSWFVVSQSVTWSIYPLIRIIFNISVSPKQTCSFKRSYFKGLHVVDATVSYSASSTYFPDCYQHLATL